MPIVVSLSNTRTSGDIIKRALRIIGAYSTGEALGPDEAQDGLAVLNSMLSAWALEKLMLHKHETVSYTPTAQSFTVGPTGDLITDRPVEILSAYQRQGGSDSPVRVIDRAEYESISQKAQSGSVECVYYKPTFPNGQVFCWPVPTGQALFLTLQQPITSFALTTTEINLPPGYEEALIFNLAVRWGSEFGMEASQNVVRTAQNAKRLIKTTNNEIPQLVIDPALTGLA